MIMLITNTHSIPLINKITAHKVAEVDLEDISQHILKKIINDRQYLPKVEIKQEEEKILPLLLAYTKRQEITTSAQKLHYVQV